MVQTGGESGRFRIGSPAVSDPVDLGRNSSAPAAPAFTFREPGEPDERDERDGQLGHKYIAAGSAGSAGLSGSDKVVQAVKEVGGFGSAVQRPSYCPAFTFREPDEPDERDEPDGCGRHPRQATLRRARCAAQAEFAPFEAAPELAAALVGAAVRSRSRLPRALGASPPGA